MKAVSSLAQISPAMIVMINDVVMSKRKHRFPSKYIISGAKIKVLYMNGSNTSGLVLPMRTLKKRVHNDSLKRSSKNIEVKGV